MTKPNNITLRHILPSVVTILAICAGLTSLRMTFDGRLEAALYCILLAAVLDAADGKLARFLDTASPFGAELDTLADFFNFGVAPGVLLYYTFYLGGDHANIGWMATLILAICCALRLARFNLSMKSPEGSAKTSAFFVGVPAPALACLALMPIFIHLDGWQIGDYPYLRALYTIGVGFLAVSTLPTYSIKHTSIRRSQVPLAFILAIVLATCLIAYTWPTLIAANLLYLASMPFAYLSHKKREKASPET